MVSASGWCLRSSKLIGSEYLRTSRMDSLIKMNALQSAGEAHVSFYIPLCKNIQDMLPLGSNQVMLGAKTKDIKRLNEICIRSSRKKMKMTNLHKCTFLSNVIPSILVQAEINIMTMSRLLTHQRKVTEEQKWKCWNTDWHNSWLMTQSLIEISSAICKYMCRN